MHNKDGENALERLLLQKGMHGVVLYPELKKGKCTIQLINKMCVLPHLVLTSPYSLNLQSVSMKRINYQECVSDQAFTIDVNF